MKRTKEFKWRLKTARKTAQMSQTDLAKRTGLMQPQISAFESGKLTPSVETLMKLAAALSVSVDWLLGIDK